MSVSAWAVSRKHDSLVRESERIARRALRALKLSNHHCDLGILPDVAMRRMKEEYLIQRVARAPHGPANVLSFPEPPAFTRAFSRSRLLGEVYINGDLIMRGKESCEHLIVHGILHLAGYLHDSDTQARRMEAKERLLMRPRRRRN